VNTQSGGVSHNIPELYTAASDNTVIQWDMPNVVLKNSRFVRESDMM